MNTKPQGHLILCARELFANVLAFFAFLRTIFLYPFQNYLITTKTFCVMRMRSLLLLFFCIPMVMIGNVISNEKKKDTLANSNEVVKESSTDQFFQLPELDTKFPIQRKLNISSAPEFSYELLEKEYNPPMAAVTDRKQEAKEGFEEINKYDKWITTFSSENIQTLPVGIKYTDSTSQVQYQVGFTKAHFNKDYTELTAFVKVLIPQSDKNGKPLELFFGASNVKLSHQGGLVGETHLVLLGDMFIPFNGGNWLLMLKGGFNMKTGNTQNKTFVTLTCDGIKEMGIEGEVQFSRKLIIPVDPSGNPVEATRKYRGADNKTIQIPNRVTGSFKAVASGWNDMIVEIGISPFVLANQPKMFMFSVNQAVFDFSDLRTENVDFPQHYYDNGLLLPNSNAWRGVYVKSLEIGLPKEFQTKETIAKESRVSFKAANLLIDSYGVSGEFMAEGVIPISTGRTSEKKAWAFSVDDIGITLASNRLIGAQFGGQIVLPVSKGVKSQEGNKKTSAKELGLSYKGIISEDEYSLVVSSLNTIEFDVFKAKAELLPNSSVELAVRDGSFRPKAVLNGRMAISASQKKSLEDEGKEDVNADTANTHNVNYAGDGTSIYGKTNEVEQSSKKTVEFRGIRFENLVLQTESPIISVDYFGYEDKVKLANFPVSISDIAFKSTDYEAGLEFTLDVSLCKAFGGGTRLGIYGEFAEEGYRQKWKYDRIELQEINLNTDLGGMEIEGSLLLMENHPEYGNGFSAEVKATFSSFGPITCKAIFGKKDFRYWYVDGAVHGLKIQAGPIQLSGFAGGAFYKMTRRKGVGPKFSPSGLSYIPNKDTSIGVKAMVYGSIGDETAISLGAGFEIEFNRHMGLNRIGFFGEAQVMKAFNFPNPLGKLTDKLAKEVGNKIAETAAKAVEKSLMKKAVDDYDRDSESIEVGASIKAYMAMEYDFVNTSFHAELDLFVNVPGGVIQGRASKGRAGWGVVHVSPDEWYVHMGTPTDRLGLKMGIGSFNMETGGYFMMGDRIPGSPPPPPEVARILGVQAETLDYMRDENALGEGRGFAFGADFKVDTGEINFLLLYGRFMAGAGFDIMLKDYGTAKCANTGDVVGIDGWYANGQSYAYLQGEMGINLKLFFVKKRIPIIKGSTAILLQAKGPNPFWMRGYATGEFDLLGGLVKGSYRFKVSLGEECEFEDATPLGGIRIIADLSPKDGEKDIDVFTAPQASFAMRVNEPVVIPEDEGDRTYKIILEQFDITDTAGKKIEGKLEWNYLKDRATFISDDILPPNTPLKVTVQVSFQEQINGVFQTILSDGKKAIEVEERSFTTGTAPAYIPLHNIQYSYPVVEQQLYYPGEYGTGYIQLQRGQDYLFDTVEWKSVVNYIDPSGKTRQTDFNYDTSNNKVFYKIPKVARETTYTMAINSSPKKAGTRSRNQTETQTTDYGDNTTVTVRKNKAENVLTDGEIERLAYEFKTSKYKTFAAKIKSIKKSHDLWGKIDSKVIYLTSRIENHEGFDLVELVGNSFSENTPLVNAEATLKDTYFGSDINPLIYQRYGPSSRYTISRDVSEYGFYPKKAVPISTSYINDLKNEVNLNWRAVSFPYRYNLMEIYNIDYRDLYRRINNEYINGVLSKEDPLLNILYHTLPYMRYGNYQIEMKYTLPGNISGSSAVYNFKNPIK
ncbi:hypothetical protein [Aquimarina aquimarini]|uniref:hypothetical protein n=1 Tax=Aquimarina aquimarini TaxID=1191734 RepID=UPI001F486D01|nr:hypothetical protein [Aquimarina aquimarini]